MAVNLSPVGGVAAQFFTNTGAVLTGGKIYTYAAGTTTPAVTYTSSNGATAQPNPIVLDAAGRVPNSGEIWLTDGINYKFVLKDSNDVLIATYDNVSGINSNFISFTNSQQIITATANQTVFNLSISYQPGTNSLSVFVDGVNQYGPSALYAYTETSSTVVTFVNGLHVGAVVKFTTSQQQGAGVTNASQITYNPAGTGAVSTNVQAKLRQYVSVVDFGATTADTTGTVNLAAFNAALAASDSVYVPDGTYIVSGQVVLRGNNLDANGRYIGKHLFGASKNGTIIKAASGYTGNNLVVIGNTNWTIDNIFSVDNLLENISLDDTNMVDSVGRSALFLEGTFNNVVRNVNQAKSGTIKTRWDITVAIGTYTTSFYDCHSDNFQVTSSVFGGVTTIAFYNCSCTFLNLYGGTTINFDHLTVQGTYSGGYTKKRIQIDQCANVSIINGDLEGDGDYINVSNSSGILVANNNVAAVGTYRQGGTDQKTKFWSVTDCNQILSRDNIFMNWTKAGAGVVGSPPYTGTYATGSGTNTQISLYDFQGAYFTGVKYNASGAITLSGSGVNTIVNFDNKIYDSPTRYLTNFSTTPPTYDASAVLVSITPYWRFTAPIAGIYSVNVGVLLSAFVDATSVAVLTVCVNGTEVARSLANKNNTTSGNCYMQIQTDVKINAADYIDARLSYTNASYSIVSAPTTNAISIKYVGCI